MGRICPILNHPLNDGVLVGDEVLVNFIRKRNLDFLPNELVCRSCKREVVKLYNKKLKKALELHKSRMHDGSVSSLKASKTSSSAFGSSERSLSPNESLHREQAQLTQNGENGHVSKPFHQLNGHKTKSIEQQNIVNSSRIINIPTANISAISSTSSTHNILQENQNNQVLSKKTITEEYGNKSNVTIRKKTIKDYLNVKLPTQAIVPQVTMATRSSPRRNVSAIQIVPQLIDVSTDNDDDVIRRLSQEPTTSKAVNVNKRRISEVVATDDDDDECLSLNAVNGTHLPHIQPIPPKRKPAAALQNTLAQDIMNEYIKVVNGG